ncbi:MAG: phosphoribosylamine--glycine ligase [Candidatus Melainabacteria bacterium RIFCSPLOWO2_02_FULL_35_15]|nr:MAG: phosphoribosylamine--glycine ligase [Candidatus Melainabacteria bacterium RIFCSPLOWO2_12_FULL_35_11]OGI13108.1 MAG: phosphoribosylamine--glycine ligase [Candidatus Melainabacteria bacterium RIFCSPLOWO2_02_FULL_35_15]
MNVLVIGSGGREHAICWKLHQSSHVKQIFCSPGNAGIAEIATCVPVSPTDIERLAEFAIVQKIDLTIASMDEPLARGIVDYFRKKGLRIFGPTKEAAKLEWSKYFAKEFMLRHNIPTAPYACFEQKEFALAYAKSQKHPIVVKADGLALGKGVTVAQSFEEAKIAIHDCFDGKFGQAGEKVVIEEFMRGHEVSVFAISDGKDAVTLVPAQDYKRLYDGDSGPNTGGMGAYAPVPFMTGELIGQVKEEIIMPTIKGMEKEGNPYHGILYCGLMVTDESKIKVVEFNSRLGDPEAQVVLPLLDEDLFEICWAVTEGELGKYKEGFHRLGGAALCVVIASDGYPENYRKGIRIDFSKLNEPVEIVSGKNPQTLEAILRAKGIIFHAGTARDADGRLVSNGGRVLGVTALADSLLDAQVLAYKLCERIDFEGKYYRKDIGDKGMV